MLPGELRSIGDRTLFEYHCKESHDSEDACIWYRSHEQVTIIDGPFWDGMDVHPDDIGAYGITRQARADNACVLYYRVQFKDGFEYEVFEDELVDSIGEYIRSDPPQSYNPA